MTLALPTQAAQGYSCDFETPAERDRWTLNQATSAISSKLVNKWYIGAPGNNSRTGRYGLYVSNDGGTTAQYTNSSCYIFAYDTLSLDQPASGEYTIVFDYCAMGNALTASDGLYLLWVPMTKASGDSIKIMCNNTFGGSVPKAYEDYVIRLQPTSNMDNLNGVISWRQCAAKIPASECNGQPHYLAFMWANGSNTAQQPGGMVDNISIFNGSLCDAPTQLDFEVQGSTTVVSWKGTGAAQYEVSAYAYKDGSWYGPRLTTDTFAMFSNITMGEVDVIVRAVCDGGAYSLKTIKNDLVYYPDQMCVDYLNLDNAVCYTATMPGTADTRTFNTFTVERVDDGPTQKSSRHTVHFDKQERDRRTGFLAPTVPEGELASVRLGNWNNGAEAEQIEFSFEVDTIQYPVLLLKYLPILEAPGHTDDGNPRFKMDLLINGVSIGECGKADFNCNDVYADGELLPGAAEQGWHITPNTVAFPEDTKDGYNSRDNVVWKEWTTVGVNLRNKSYAGKTLTARLTTFDCPYSAHCGYAYFTLGCSDGKLKDMKCGEINPDFKAPDGFVYRWAYASSEKYRRADGSLPEQYVLGHDQVFHAGMQDDSLYVVDCMFVQDSSCYFSLYCSTLATNPVSVMNKPEIHMNCRANTYTVTFDASPSWVQEIDHVKEDTLVSKTYKIENYEWTVEGITGGWSDEIKPTFSFPVEGGDFLVTLRTTCGSCENTLTYNLHLDPLGATRETRTITLCDADRKDGFVWTEKPDTLYRTYCLDSVVLFNPATSCDSIIYLQLVEPLRIPEDTMLLPESLPFTHHGRTYDVGTKSLIDTIPSPTNCDTTWVLNLEIYESLLASMPDSAYILCSGDPVLTLIYDITRGRSLRYSYTFADSEIPSSGLINEVQKKGHYEIPISIDPNLYPNVYSGQLLLVDSMPEFSITFPFTVTVRYASSVIAQRWNDVLAIKNTDHNGGFVFDSVQWYVNGLPIEGATDFNYYVGEGHELQFGAPYAALLTRNDGVKLFTCDIYPSPVSAEITDLPSLLPPSAPLQLRGKGTAYWYDLLGRSSRVEPYNDSYITTPSAVGCYILVLQTATGRTMHEVMIR